MYYGIPLRAARLRRFYAQFVTPGSLCFDVGAHAGNRVRCWRQLGARVVAIEPQPDFVRLLTWLFGQDADVTIVAKAVGRTAGNAELLVSERTPTVTSLSQTWVDDVRRDPRFKSVSWTRGERVEVVTLQSLVERHGEPAFIKIDIEGFEPECLQGGRATIARDAPAMAVCVYHLQSHIWDIPLQLDSYFGDYRFKLCPHVADGWDLVLYAVPSNRLPS